MNNHTNGLWVGGGGVVEGVVGDRGGVDQGRVEGGGTNTQHT